MFAGRAERNRGSDSVSVIILRCLVWGVSQLFLDVIAFYDRRRTQMRSVAGLPRWMRGGRWPVTESVIVSSYSR